MLSVRFYYSQLIDISAIFIRRIRFDNIFCWAFILLQRIRIVVLSYCKLYTIPEPKWKLKKSLLSSFTIACFDWMADATFDGEYNSIQNFRLASKHSSMEYFGFVLLGNPLHESVPDM